MYSVAVTLVCWLFAVFASTFSYLLTICFQCIGCLLKSPGSSTDERLPGQVTCRALSLRSKVIAVTMDYYSHERCYGRGPSYNQRRYWGRPSDHWPGDENMPHDFRNEYGDFANAHRCPEEIFRYPIFNGINTDRIWSRTADANIGCPDSAEEVRSSVNYLQ